MGSWRGCAARPRDGGKILDGLSDGLRFANLYIELMARLIVAGDHQWWLVIAIGVLAGLAHARQSGAVDVIRQLYMYLAEGGGGEFNLPEDFDDVPAVTPFARFQVRFYRNYLERTTRMLPNSVRLVRRVRAGDAPPNVAEAWAVSQLPIVRQCAWIGQNIRFALLAFTVVPGSPAGFLWVTLIPMSLVMLLLVVVHERRAAAILGSSPHSGTYRTTAAPERQPDSLSVRSDS